LASPETHFGPVDLGTDSNQQSGKVACDKENESPDDDKADEV
jgi:hypothetical protein